MEKIIKTGWLIFYLTAMVACNQTKEKIKTEQKLLVENADQNEAYELLKIRCYVCHQINSKSHDELVAPPMVAVKKRYLMAYSDKVEFIESIVKWTENPNQEKALMRGAVGRFKVMPYQEFDETEIRKIAEYIYENELEKPQWFDEHEKEMHGKRRKNELR